MIRQYVNLGDISLAVDATGDVVGLVIPLDDRKVRRKLGRVTGPFRAFTEHTVHGHPKPIEMYFPNMKY